jgi:hypothetical protein
MAKVEIARVHVDDYDPEIYTGEGALELALAAASLFRDDFPNAVVGVSYNPYAAEKKRERIMASFGFTE